MPRPTARMSPLAVVAVVLTSVFAAVALLAVGLVWAAFAWLSTPPNPNEATRDVVTKGVQFDECEQVVTGRLERHYDWNNTTPLDVTVVAYTPDGPAEGCRVTAYQLTAKNDFRIDLTTEQAAAFAHPQAKRTASIVRADGQLIQEEAAW